MRIVDSLLPRHQQLLEVLLPGHKIARVEYIELESERDGAPQAAITKARKNRPDTQKALLSAIDKRGIAIGEERGIAIGKELGEKRGKLETARAMLKELPIDQVARFTGLSREELQSLANEIAPQG